jgi:hypothetical protein
MKATKPAGRARVTRERENLETRLRLYCHRHHHSAGICPECSLLLDYAAEHLEKCRFGLEKPNCENCSFQCFSPSSRERIKAVISETRPRMLWQHPHLSLRHWFDGFHNAPGGSPHGSFGSWGSE